MRQLTSTRRRWALKWRSECQLDGKTEYLFGEFMTRAVARRHRDERYGYIKDRPDLRAEPHGWRIPSVVKILVTTREVEQ